MSTQQPTPKTAPRITPLRETWQQLMSSARSRAPQLRASLIGLGLAAALQGLALACLMPLFQALIPQADWTAAWPWLLAMTALMLASTAVPRASITGATWCTTPMNCAPSWASNCGGFRWRSCRTNALAR